jgi:formylglycine-generating enzyme required for sulfatase activity
MPINMMTPAALLIICISCSSKPQKPPPQHRDGGVAASVRVETAVVPAGWFSAGCYRLLANATLDHPSETPDAERLTECVEDDPPRRVWVSSFEIDRNEVTIADYQRCLAARACGMAANHLGVHGSSPDPDNYAAEVRFVDAAAYCAWRGNRLPTDAEWEKAGRGSDDRIYPWGDTAPTCDRVSSADPRHDGFTMPCDGDARRPPGTLPAGASPYGVEDLEDNAAEWVADWQTRPAHATAPMPEKFYTRAGDVLIYNWDARSYTWLDQRVVDPKGPPTPERADPSRHRLKGGFVHPGISGSSYGEGNRADLSDAVYAGFRCARDHAGPPPPTVAPPKDGTFVVPYREQGYVPPKQ